MNRTTFVTRVIARLSLTLNRALYCFKSGRRDTSVALLGQGDIALRDSAAFALSCYWARYYEGWSLVLFRDASGLIRHVACKTANRTIVDAHGQCTEEQIAERLGMYLSASHGEETDVQPLLRHHNDVLVAADELRQRLEHETTRQEAATGRSSSAVGDGTAQESGAIRC